MDDFTSLDAHWIWAVLGLGLAALELVVPGVYLIWLAVAALVTAAMTFALDLSLPVQIVDFAFLALIAVFSARRLLRDQPIVGEDPLLNNRGGRLVGEVATVTQPIEHGSGRVRHGDSEWNARGPELASGTRVRIIGNDGITLIVEPLTLLKDEGTAPPVSAG